MSSWSTRVWDDWLKDGTMTATLSWNRRILKTLLTLSLPNVAKGKFRPNIQISFSKMLTNK